MERPISGGCYPPLHLMSRSQALILEFLEVPRRGDMMMTYLTAALMAIWVLLAVYLFLLGSREKKLRVEIQRLRQMLERPPYGGSG